MAVEARHVVVAAADPRVGESFAPSTPVRSLEEIDAADGDEFGGWGLGIVQSIAERVWVQPTGLDGAAGKWVCAAIRIAPASA
ncbi:hypothetical protein ACFQ07_02980 [Actinomadura adrarensis]|uniref:ATP-binding protein n=1 Tax=Actinomadura adrarensis TaxID=1819600 RepID=A0ABW3C9P6_9ACTN